MNKNRKDLIFLIALVLLAQGCLKPGKTGKQLLTQSASEQTKTPMDTATDIYAEHVRTTAFKTPAEERLSFVLPPGFEATLFASEPDITKPINMAFDEKGRLWVTQSSEYPVAAGPGQGKDRISILEDTNHDGRADKIIEFANDLNIPIGIMPVKGGAIAYSIPNVYHFIDSDGDDKADKREVLLGKFGHKDTHGMVNNLIRGFDGWIHASHGYANTSKIAGKDQDSITMFSGNTFRFTPDGRRVEKTTDGRINPFGSAYDEMGYQYSADCHTLPIYQLIWGGDYTQWGKKERSMGFAPTMMDYDLNSTALAGLVYYTDTQFPEEYRNSFYSGDVVTCRISRNVMTFHGSTPKATRKEDFLVSRDPWFRPVDLKVGPDGALYIADFYNRIIGHYEVPINHPGRDRVSGRIWKITYKGNKENPVIDWSKVSLSKLVAALNHNVLATRMRATDELVDRYGVKALPALKKVVRRKRTSPEQLIQAIWALYRLHALPDKALFDAINHKDARVQVHALKVLANFKTLSEEQRTIALKSLVNSNPHVQRAAAELLSRHPSPQSYRRLITLVQAIPDYDTHLRYTVLMSLKNHLAQTDIMQRVATEKWNEKEADILAMVTADVHSAAAGQFLFQYFQTHAPTPERQLIYTQSIARNIPDAELNQVVRFLQSKNPHNLEQQYQLAKALNSGIEQRGAQENTLYQEWNIKLATTILQNAPTTWNKQVQAQQLYAADIAGKYKVSSLEPYLKNIVALRTADEETRGVAAGALINLAPAQNAPSIFKVLTSGEESMGMRQKFAQALGQSALPPVRALLGEGLRGAPYEVQETIASLLVKDKAGKSQLIKLIRQGYAPARLLKARTVEEALLANIEPKQHQDYEELTAGILPVSEERQKLIQERLATFSSKGKTVSMGNAVFTKNCSMCHQIDKKGGLIGPQLDGVGNWGKEALATKILDPNRNISEAFRTYTITLKNGKTVSGLYRRDEGQLLVLADRSGQEFTIAQQDIQEKTASPYTLMPDHFNSTIPKEEFDALLVYLLNNKK
ncbi:dehydrogenase [Adhaeribacter arboris]|uniref:Dehydrogenase n=1 Tax=Adhaeribacter arboris TaxID=2072846 RepID=A0A2T2YIZ8_9BACT|nr:PVC-type heme-binding CxxCH protein [Adhaeribacter arboris]PSR55469.1 dehydrogenase [Adhaeribacter arboris]